MSALTFYQLGQLLYEAINKPNACFFDLINVFCNLRKEEIVSLINNFLKEIIVSSKIIEQNYIYFYQQPNVHLLMRFTKHKAAERTLSSSEVDAIIMNLSDKTVNIPKYYCSIDPNDLSTKPSALKQEDDLILSPYKPYCLSAFSSILDFHNASHKVPLIIVHSDKKSWSTWAFDRDSLEPVRRISTDIRASRIQLTLQLFQALQVREIEQILEKLILSNYDGNVRWEAMKYYYKINRDNALHLLQKIASQDNDPAIQRISQETLKDLSRKLT